MTLPSTSASPPPPASPQNEPLAERLGRLELLHRISLALSSEKNRDRLIETILIEAQDVPTLPLRAAVADLLTGHSVTVA